MFKKPSNWDVLVDKANTIAAYKGIVQAMFNDNIVTYGRLVVLEVYTLDVCKKYPTIAQDIQSLYVHIYDQLNPRWYHSPTKCLRIFCRCIISLVIELYN